MIIQLGIVVTLWIWHYKTQHWQKQIRLGAYKRDTLITCGMSILSILEKSDGTRLGPGMWLGCTRQWAWCRPMIETMQGSSAWQIGTQPFEAWLQHLRSPGPGAQLAEGGSWPFHSGKCPSNLVVGSLWGWQTFFARWKGSTCCPNIL